MKAAHEENQGLSLDELKKRLIAEALDIEREDVEINRQIGQFGAELIKDGDSILTHCNAGGLATAAYGTALGVIRAAFEQGKKIRVFADETRPFLQGARLTAWELEKLGIPYFVISDSMAGWLMRKGEIDLAVVGADRITPNGDTANKIGTYSVAVLAKENHIPFYVAAPLSTFDFSLETGDQIPIEERPPEEVKEINGKLITPAGARVRNPAFDVTPAGYITAIITEKGVIRPPYEKNLADLRK
jgi:methylthioribose-1-phosphate isomerase